MKQLLLFVYFVNLIFQDSISLHLEEVGLQNNKTFIRNANQIDPKYLNQSYKFQFQVSDQMQTVDMTLDAIFPQTIIINSSPSTEDINKQSLSLKSNNNMETHILNLTQKRDRRFIPSQSKTIKQIDKVIHETPDKEQGMFEYQLVQDLISFKNKQLTKCNLEFQLSSNVNPVFDVKGLPEQNQVGIFSFMDKRIKDLQSIIDVNFVNNHKLLTLSTERDSSLFKRHLRIPIDENGNIKVEKVEMFNQVMQSNSFIKISFASDQLILNNQLYDKIITTLIGDYKCNLQINDIYCNKDIDYRMRLKIDKDTQIDISIQDYLRVDRRLQSNLNPSNPSDETQYKLQFGSIESDEQMIFLDRTWVMNQRLGFDLTNNNLLTSKAIIDKEGLNLLLVSFLVGGLVLVVLILICVLQICHRREDHQLKGGRRRRRLPHIRSSFFENNKVSNFKLQGFSLTNSKVSASSSNYFNEIQECDEEQESRSIYSRKSKENDVSKKSILMKAPDDYVQVI